MQRELVIANLALGEKTLVDVFLNDLPLEDALLRGTQGLNGPVNHLLIPGENRLDLFVHKAPIRDDTSVRFMIARQAPGSTDPKDVILDLDVRFPACLDELPERFRRVPCHYSKAFDVPAQLARPTHLNASIESFGIEGEPSLRQAVMDLHAALEARDADRYIELASLRMEELARALEGHAEHTVAAQEATYREFLARPLIVRPLAIADLAFEPRARGRVAYVRRIDGTPALYAKATDDSGELLTARLVFIKHQQMWRLY